MANLLAIGAAVTACLGVGFLIISLGTNYWRSVDVGKVNVHQGLFQTCSTMTNTYCAQLYKKIGDVPASMHGVRALMILSVMIECVAIIAGAISILMKKNWNVAIVGAQGIAVIFSVAGLAIYASKFDDIVYSLNWSYALGWIGVVFLGSAIATLILTMIR